MTTVPWPARAARRETDRTQDDRRRLRIDNTQVTVRGHLRRRLRRPARCPNGLRRTVDARADRTRYGRKDHRCSAPGLHASPPTDPTRVFYRFPQPTHRQVLRETCVQPLDSRSPVFVARAPGVYVRSHASRRKQSPDVVAHLRASARRSR